MGVKDLDRNPSLRAKARANPDGIRESGGGVGVGVGTGDGRFGFTFEGDSMGVLRVAVDIEFTTDIDTVEDERVDDDDVVVVVVIVVVDVVD